jgi:hypothetical protein
MRTRSNVACPNPFKPALQSVMRTSSSPSIPHVQWIVCRWSRSATQWAKFKLETSALRSPTLWARFEAASYFSWAATKRTKTFHDSIDLPPERKVLQSTRPCRNATECAILEAGTPPLWAATDERGRPFRSLPCCRSAHGDRRPGKLFGHPFDQAKNLHRSNDAFGPDGLRVFVFLGPERSSPRHCRRFRSAITRAMVSQRRILLYGRVPERGGFGWAAVVRPLEGWLKIIRTGFFSLTLSQVCRQSRSATQ